MAVGCGRWCIADAASATVAAIEHGRPGIYHVGDDEPAPVRDWLPKPAHALGAGPPRRIPTRPVRLLAGKGPVNVMTQARGISSEKTERELDWAPQYPTWRTGFIEGLEWADMSASDLYGEVRPQAFAIAYRMLGNVSEAEDVVQEAFLWSRRRHERQEGRRQPVK